VQVPLEPVLGGDPTAVLALIDLPAFISDVAVIGPVGENIGSASGARYNIGDRDYFQQALAGQPIAVG
jgi:hypothetical protein